MILTSEVTVESKVSKQIRKCWEIYPLPLRPSLALRKQYATETKTDEQTAYTALVCSAPLGKNERASESVLYRLRGSLRERWYRCCRAGRAVQVGDAVQQNTGDDGVVARRRSRQLHAVLVSDLTRWATLPSTFHTVARPTFGRQTLTLTPY